MWRLFEFPFVSNHYSCQEHNTAAASAYENDIYVEKKDGKQLSGTFEENAYCNRRALTVTFKFPNVEVLHKIDPMFVLHDSIVQIKFMHIRVANKQLFLLAFHRYETS